MFTRLVLAAFPGTVISVSTSRCHVQSWMSANCAGCLPTNGLSLPHMTEASASGRIFGRNIAEILSRNTYFKLRITLPKPALYCGTEERTPGDKDVYVEEMGT